MTIPGVGGRPKNPMCPRQCGRPKLPGHNYCRQCEYLKHQEQTAKRREKRMASRMETP